ncbi:MAG: LTA synthase family protein [Streptococcaceae bacterium]|nr:LTA synthase family protein [Streptococcaceae bacterium]
MNLKNKLNFVNTRIGFYILLLALFWVKSIFAYFVDFQGLGLESAFQYFILFLNPLASSMLLFGIALYIRGRRSSYITMMVIFTLLTMLLFSNVTYYREFSDFITVNTMLGSAKVASGLGESAVRLLRPYDLFYWIDIIVLIVLLAMKKIKMVETPVKGRFALAISALSVMLFSANLSLAEMDRPELLKRTFSHDYIVKYLSIPVYTIYDGVKTYQSDQVRAQASPTDLNGVQAYINEHFAPADQKMFGIDKRKNVIYIHLESFQQFLLDYKLKDENGVEHVVTPFLNSIYHSKDTVAFDNYFHQVAAGKTSDAETLYENSFFGLAQGPLFTQLGSTNTFQAAPNILQQTQGYTSAVFHGNSGSFWNRNETYKSLGYNYFFDSSYYELNKDNSFQYGLHDKSFFGQSVQYLEHLQQPFYAKFISVSNHYPYQQFTNEEGGFPLAKTSDETINGYFATANYLDRAVEEFFTYLKDSGLYNKSVIVLYGDHYGISNSRNKDLAPLLGKDPTTWDSYDNAMLQRVPYMIHMPGYGKGFIDHTYGGQVDALPTLLHLLGVDTKKYLQLGQDLFSSKHQEIVAFRNGNVITPEFTILGEDVYDTKTGEKITNPTAEQQTKIQQARAAVKKQLAVSDQITNGDLLRFYNESGLKPIHTEDYVYQNAMQKMNGIEKELGDKSTSLFTTRGNKTSTDLFKTETYQELQGNEATNSSTVESSSDK